MTFRASSRRRAAAYAAALLGAFPFAAPLRAAGGPPPAKAGQGGIAVELSIQPIDGHLPLTEGQDARVTLRMSDAAGLPLTGLKPGAWIDRASAADCKQKVETFLGGSLLSRPALDLNVYYVLALNEDATISVVDPLFGYGNSKLLTMVFLKSPGEDWALAPDGGRLFVSMPDANRVAVVDTASWKVEKEIETGPHPRRLGLQPDGQYLLVAHDAGVAVIDAHKLARAADIATGPGWHDLAFSDDNRFAFVTNEAGGTVSVIATGKLARLRDVGAGARPVSIAWSTPAQAAYVASADGTIVAVDGESAQPRARLRATPGLSQIRFAPGGRLAFIVHPSQKAVHILDATSNRIIQTADVEAEPDQVAFSDELAYIRHRGSDAVLMIPLKTVGEAGKPVPVVDFPGGEHPPGRMARPTPAAGIVQTPGEASVLVANPEDKVIYFYKEGMAAPMGHFQNYGKQPRAVQVVDRSLREVRPGVYQTTAKMAEAGDYELALFLDSPKLVRCFPVKLAEDPVRAAARKVPLLVQPAVEKSTVAAGADVAVRFKLAEPEGGAPRTGLKDVRVLTFLAPGIWQRRQWANEVDKGVYEIHFTPPQAGVYYVFVEISSAGMPMQKSPFLVLTAEAQQPQPAPGGKNR